MGAAKAKVAGEQLKHNEDEHHLIESVAEVLEFLRREFSQPDKSILDKNSPGSCAALFSSCRRPGQNQPIKESVSATHWRVRNRSDSSLTLGNSESYKFGFAAASCRVASRWTPLVVW